MAPRRAKARAGITPAEARRESRRAQAPAHRRDRRPPARRLPRQPHRPRLRQPARAPGGDDPLRPVHGQAGQRGDAGALPPLPERPPLRRGAARRARGDGPARPASSATRRGRSKGLGQALVAEHGGEVPDTMEELHALPGVGRKTANVVLGNAFGKNEGVVVDTHVQRLSRRLGLTRRDRSGEDRARPDAARAAGGVDALVPPADRPRPERSARRGRPECAALPGGRAVPFGGGVR